MRGVLRPSCRCGGASLKCMADRSHLTAVPVTDRRGRATTVYRNLGPGTVPSARLLPAPAVSSEAPAAPQGTPFPAIGVRDFDESKAFLRGDNDSVGRWQLAVPPALSHPEGRAAVSLAMDMTEAGAVDGSTAKLLLAYGCAEAPGYHAIDTLRVGARLVARHSESGDVSFWPKLAEAVRGLHVTPSAAVRPIATEEELDEAAAVVEFVVRAPSVSWDDLVRSHHSKSLGGWKNTTATTIRNPHLRALIRERPGDLDRIIEYIAERGMHRTRRRDVDELREWLDSGSPTALGPGWL